ncbi:hypothetical protein GCM10017687_23700 [Streptomyces echinatus]|uniref:hypothetical protein n=1 Tax=Streptomyces echinatus TaxID=67293 RepID=UPI0031EB706E
MTDDPTVDAATKATFQRLADAVFTDRTQALVKGADQTDTRHTSGFSGSVRLSGGSRPRSRSPRWTSWRRPPGTARPAG